MNDAPSEDSLQTTAQLIQVLADPARLRILSLLRSRGELCSCEIGPVTGYIPSKISRHLAVMKHAGLLLERRKGTYIHYRLAPADDPLVDRLFGIVDQLSRTDPCLQNDQAPEDSSVAADIPHLSIL